MDQEFHEHDLNQKGNEDKQSGYSRPIPKGSSLNGISFTREKNGRRACKMVPEG